MADKTTHALTKTVANKLAKQDAFLAAMSEGVNNIGEAAEVAGMNRATHYFWMETDSEYAKRFDAADARGKNARARSRAVLAAKVGRKAEEAIDSVKLEAPEDIRRWAETAIDKGRLADGESTQNISGKLQIPERRERTPEEREANHKLLQGDDDDGDT